MSEETTVPGSDRTPRRASSRSSKAARKPWTPPQVLETPEAPEGMRYRWVRTHIRGEADKTNVHMRFREGTNLYTQVKFQAMTCRLSMMVTMQEQSVSVV